MPQMLLPMFPYEATSINPLLGFCRKNDIVYYFNGMMPMAVVARVNWSGYLHLLAK